MPTKKSVNSPLLRFYHPAAVFATFGNKNTPSIMKRRLDEDRPEENDDNVHVRRLRLLQCVYPSEWETSLDVVIRKYPRWSLDKEQVRG